MRILWIYNLPLIPEAHYVSESLSLLWILELCLIKITYDSYSTNIIFV